MDSRIEKDLLETQTQGFTRRQALYVLGAGVAASSAALLGLSGCGCVNTSPQDVAPVEVWESPYDWDALMTNTQGRKYYYPDGQLCSKMGVDVSDYDGDIDWAAVAADGIEFAIVRAGYRGYTEGGLFSDEHFRVNIENARANYIPVGAYFFSSAVTEEEAREEAAFVLEALDGFVLEYPVVYDQEQVSDSAGRANNLTNAQYTANARAFCQAVEAAGYQAMVYGNQYHLAKLDHDGDLARYPVWYAEYNVPQPTGRFNFTMWQYTSEGSVAGIAGGCDMDIQFLEPEVPVAADAVAVLSE